MARSGPGRSILMSADAVGGVWNYCLELASELCRGGDEVHLATMGPRPSAAQIQEAEAVEGLRLYISDFALEWMSHPWEEVRAAGDWLEGLARELLPDVIHLNQYAFGQLSWPWPTLVVGHSCVLSWFEAVKGAAPTTGWERYQEQVRAGLLGADRVVAPTKAMLNGLERHYGPLKNTRVIYNGREPARFLPGKKRPLVFSAGRLWDEAKNLRCLVEAADDIFWPIYVAGDQRHPEGQTSTIPAVVQLLGQLDQERMAGWYQRAAIYAHPARYEPFGLTPLEAGLAGCALVLGDLPSLREVWGESAIYVSPDDAKGLADAINELSRRPDLRRQRSALARERALRYLPRSMADRYRLLYDELCQSQQTVARGIG